MDLKEKHPLRVIREQQDLSIDDLAEETGLSRKTIIRAEQGHFINPSSRRVLRSYFSKQLGYHVTSQDLGLGEEVRVIQPYPTRHSCITTQAMDRNQNLGHEDMLKRRELLQLLSLATALVLPLPELDWERVEDTLSKPYRLDTLVLRDLATINDSYWTLFKLSPQKRTLLDGVLGQLKSLTAFLETSHTISLHRQLCVLISDLGQLLGEILFDCNDYDIAGACYTFAASAAKEAGHYDLWACALIRHAFLPIYEGQYHTALPLLQRAQKIAHHGDTKLATRYWAAAVFADAQSGAGNLPACQQALDQMDAVQDLKNGSNGGWLRFDRSRLLEQRGTCFVKLRQPTLAIPVLQKALTQQLTSRRQGMVLTDLALAHLQNGHIEQACSYASQVIEIAQQGSGMLCKGVYGLRNQLEVYARTNAVKELDQQLRLLA
jgi:tetratricopeptide (TPR) repeat protein